jgi:hypothetical protein
MIYLMKLPLSALIFGLGLTCGSISWAAMSGVFMVVKGEVKITSAGKVEVAKVGTKVTEGDTVQSGHDSRAKIVMADKNVLNISPDSKVTIEKYQNNGPAKNVESKVEFGKVRASVEQKYDGDKSKFNIRTPTAVAGVRGTDFMMGFDTKTQTSHVVTFSGMVAVGQPGPGGSIVSPVYVPPGHMTQVEGNKPPAPPAALPATELKQINQESNAEAKQPASASTSTSTSETAAGGNEKKDRPNANSAAPSSTGPSMVDSNDIGTGLEKNVNARGPASTSSTPVLPPPIPPSVVPKTAPTQSPFLNDAIKNQKTHTSIIIAPQ